VTQAQAAPVSSFTSDKTSGNAPLTVNFTSTSTGTITSYSWSFGDGGTSTNQNPSHTFSSSGSYTVTLTVTGPGGSNSSNNTITVAQAQTLTLTTTAITSITSTTAISGGNITNDGGSAVTARGVCWSTTANPTTANIKTSDGTGTGIFTSNITGLTANTTYHVRAYATNSTITAYGTGNDQIFTTSAAVVVPTAPSSLTANAINPTTVNLTWTDNSNNETGFEIQRQNPNNSNLWVVVTTIGPNVTNYSNTGLSETWPGYQVRAINASGSSAFSNIAYAPAKLRIINNLYSSTSSSGNDWGNLNTVIWVRIGPTQASVQQNGNTYERLTPYDAVASIGLVISPAYNSTSSWADFPVSTYGYGGNYYTYIQCGWWDLDINTFLWVKHASSVLCNNGTCCCIKGMYNTFTNHTSGYVVVTMTGLGFPEGSWNNTLK
jgi:PKD repeat protein